jgi:hypothetical protein
MKDIQNPSYIDETLLERTFSVGDIQFKIGVIDQYHKDDKDDIYGHTLLQIKVDSNHYSASTVIQQDVSTDDLKKFAVWILENLSAVTEAEAKLKCLSKD